MPDRRLDQIPSRTPDGSEYLLIQDPDSLGYFKARLDNLGYALSEQRNRITVGRTGSGADFECDGTDDQIEINSAITLAAITPNVQVVEILGYGYDFQYSINGVITLLATSNGSGVAMVNILGNNTVLKCANGYSGDVFITQNFYSEIYTNYNSYSTIGNGVIQGLTIEGNSVNQVTKTLIYSTSAGFPTTGVTGKVYVDNSGDGNFGVGYLWNGSAYTTTGIANSGKHWRAYANHLIKIYGYNYTIRDCSLRDASEFSLYSEQTNTDTNVFNNYATMEASLERIRLVGYNLGGINWYGPHDSRWSDVKGHTNEYATACFYGAFVTQTANSNGGGLVWDDVHFWGPTASYGTNVILRNTNVYGNAYIEGSSNQGLYATGCTIQLDLKVTNNGVYNVRMNNCYNSILNIDNVYQFLTTATLVKLEGTLKDSEVNVRIVETSNTGASTKVFDVSTLTDSNIKLHARIPYTATAIDPGVTATSLSASSEIDIVRMGSTSALARAIRKLPAGTSLVTNVRHFGAVGDDSTDDTAAIQAAVAAAGEGGVVYFPPGKYRTLSPIYLTRGVTLRGSQGLRWRYVITPNVYIKPRSTFSGLAAIIMQDKEQGPYATEQGGQRIENINIDMSALTTGTADGILGSGLIRDVRMTNVSVSYARGKCIRTVSYTRADASVNYPRGWQLSHVVADTGFDNGFNFNNLTDSVLNDCVAVGNLANGFYIAGSGENLYSNCRAVFNKNNGFNITGSTFGNSAFSNCSTDRNEYNGVSITATGKYPIAFSNLVLRRDGRNGNSGGGSYAGLNLSSSTAPVVVDNLQVVPGVDDNASGTNSPQYGVSSTSSDLTITSGHIWGASTALNNVTNTIFAVGPFVQLATGTNAGKVTTYNNGLTLPSTAPLITSGTVTFSGTTAPASAVATGTAGTIAFDANYIYICTAANTWKRVAIATW